MLNRIILMGRLTRDPELRTTGSNIAVCSFSLACDRDFKSDKGEKEYMYDELSMPSLAHDFPRYSFAQGLAAVNLCYYYLLMAAFMASCVHFIRRGRAVSLALPLGVILAGTAVLLLVGHGEARFHIPFMPFVIITAAAYLADKRSADKRSADKFTADK